jgi:hypothetical protein
VKTGRKPKAEYALEGEYVDRMTHEDLEIIAEMIARWILERQQKITTQS